ncbi:CGA/CIA family class A beta-lactamase [Chryseobacterium sp. OSA05B]|uniref:CGA/CIA family class A beta-lactamase n=1 Tax=Chryseobacterium sp. OSA05B TaxID=2862650 RepID=UPI001CBAFE95|nr:CGA/CIA family class A beta-lactamase [Chryseobacterium sp. OSA05B]
MKKIGLFFLLISVLATAQKSVLEQKINAITEGKKATVGVSVLGFENNFKYSKNGDQPLPTLSVFKFHIACTVLDLVDRGKLSLNQKLFFKKEDMLENTWSPIREKYPDANISLSLGEVLDYTVALSDNNGCDVLLKLIGGTQTVQKFMDSKGVKGFQIKHNEAEMHKSGKALYENYSTPRSAIQVLKKFYDGKLLTKKSTDYLMKIMIGTKTGTNKIVEQLPKNTPVAHKTGSSGKNDNGLTIAENDMGIITLPNGNHYAIAIFVNDSMETDAVNCKMVSDISKAVWDDFNK